MHTHWLLTTLICVSIAWAWIRIQLLRFPIMNAHKLSLSSAVWEQRWVRDGVDKWDYKCLSEASSHFKLWFTSDCSFIIELKLNYVIVENNNNSNKNRRWKNHPFSCLHPPPLLSLAHSWVINFHFMAIFFHCWIIEQEFLKTVVESFQEWTCRWLFMHHHPNEVTQWKLHKFSQFSFEGED